MQEYLEKLHSTDPITRFEAIEALAKVGEPAVPALMQMLASPNRLACRGALTTLLHINKSRFEPLLMPLLQREWEGVYGLSPKDIGTPETILSDPVLSTWAKVTRLKLLPDEYRTHKNFWGRAVVESIEEYCGRIVKDATVSASVREGARKVYEEGTLLRASRAPESVEELLRPIYGQYDPSDPDFLLRATVQSEGSASASTPPLREAEQVKQVGEYVSIPGGVYLLGGSMEDDNPPHFVSILGFQMSKYPVTVREYKSYCRAMGSEMPDAPDFNKDWGEEGHPIVNVDWEEARAYAQWAGGDLPTEAEWEVAARGGLVGKAYPWGAIWGGTKCANSVGLINRKGTVSVGSDAPNGYGLYDMAGNVWEWCLDSYDSDIWKRNAEIDVLYISDTSGHVLRGGSWYSDVLEQFRCAYRVRDIQGYRNNVIGFRVVFR
jgi:formylglycine-generating enzyme required for sulfatase activity